MSHVVVEQLKDKFEDMGGKQLPGRSLAEWSELQHQDPVIRPVMDALTLGTKPKSTNIKVKKLYAQKKVLRLNNDVLYRVRESRGEKEWCVVLPQTDLQKVLNGLHDQMGHLGGERVLELARHRVYWVGMQGDILDYVKCCRPCIAVKSKPTKAPMVPYEATRPMELVHIDFLKVEPAHTAAVNPATPKV